MNDSIETPKVIAQSTVYEQTPEELLTWYRSFGDPNGPEYIDLEVINAGLEMVDQVKKQAPSEEETITHLLRFFGMFPPSTIEYAGSFTRDMVREPNGYVLSWLDGLACGMAIYTAMAAAEGTVPG